METPLELESHPGGLRLYVPEGSVKRAAQLWAETLTPRALLALARHGEITVELPNTA